MNRLKVRAWDGEKMVNPDYITRDGIAFWQENGCVEHSKNVMQFTGLKDKNGVEVYEGDIVKVTTGFIGIVKYRSGSHLIECQDGKFYYLGEFVSHLFYDVIGNIHENEELIK